MKKATLVFLGAVFVLASLGIASVLTPLGESIVEAEDSSLGMTNDEIEAVQEILKEDPSIYPEGYVTGYFGSLTAKAVNKLQKKFGLPETHKIDLTLLNLMFPRLGIKVLSPNGGEVWSKNSIQTIKWNVILPVGKGASQDSYFRPKASIDLFRKVRITADCSEGLETSCQLVEKTVFVKHIATVDLFSRTYSWEVPEDIQDSNDYIVRISTGRNIIPFILRKSNVNPQDVWSAEAVSRGRIAWDESDQPFTIKEKQTPYLEEAIKILESTASELNRAIRLLKKI